MPTRIDAPRVLVDAETEILDGSVIVKGDRIAWVGPTAEAPEVDETIVFEDGVLMPGLVNAHVHLDLSHLKGKVPYEGEFAAWIQGVARGRRLDEAGTGITAALRESLVRGTTAFGDVVTTRHFDQVVEAFAETGARGRLFIEAIGFRPDAADEVFDRVWEHMEMRAVPDNVQTGVSPHAPYTVSRPLLNRLISVAEGHERPVAIHVGESLEELAFLRHGIGPFREMLRNYEMDDPDFVPEGSIDGFLKHLAMSNAPLLIVHANYMRPRTVPGGAFVVYCPTAHAFFSHPEHPVMELLQEGVRVALGSDSAASGETVDLLTETQYLARERTDLPAKTVFRMATEWGARALALDTGSLHVGKYADLAAFTPDLGYGTLGAPDAECLFTMVGGNVVHGPPANSPSAS
jgi:cytosine/adenosine deaminase-related metal-dependent hydrolase